MLIGAGGHAKVVFEALVTAGYPPGAISVRADHAQVFMGQDVLSPECPDDLTGSKVHVAIGANPVRARFLAQAEQVGGAILSVIHPDASLSGNARIGQGTLLAARAVIAACAEIGRGVIVNHGAIVDHDCVVGDHAHIAPGAVLGGGVRVGRMALVGANATILPGLEVGESAVIGAGAVVTKSVAAGSVWIGSAAVSKEHGS